MSASEPSARLAIHDLDDLVGLVPYLVGFHPQSSLVVLMIDGGRMGVLARVDLAPMGDPVAMSQLISRLFERFPGGEAWCLAYTEDLKLAWTVLEAAAEAVGEDRLGRLVQVGRQRWRADHAAGLSGQVNTEELAAQAAAWGLPLRDSRADLVAQVAGPDPGEMSGLEAEFEAAAAAVAAMTPGVRRQRGLTLASANSISRADLVELAVLAAEAETHRLLVELLDKDQAPAAVLRWRAVVELSPPDYATAPLGLLGVAGWLTGDGALLTVCLERLDAMAALVPLTAMLDWINTTVLPPAAWPQYRAALVGALADHERLLSTPESA